VFLLFGSFALHRILFKLGGCLYATIGGFGKASSATVSIFNFVEQHLCFDSNRELVDKLLIKLQLIMSSYKIIVKTCVEKY
jgi:hypothetical protein